MHAKWLAVLFCVLLLSLLLACEKPKATQSRTDNQPAATSDDPKVMASATVTEGSDIDGLEGVVAEMHGDLKRCYLSALESDPKMAGTVRVTLDVGSNGAIGSATTAAGKGISKKLATCIASRVRKGKFKAPKGPRATLMVKVDCAP